MLSAAAQILGTQIAGDKPALLALNKKELKKQKKKDLEEKVTKKVSQDKKKAVQEAHVSSPTVDILEVKLNKIARRVVKFFNVLKKQQKEMEEKERPPATEESRKKFMNMLKGKREEDEADGEDEGEPDFLKTDYMLGAKLRDFDKPSADPAEGKSKRARKSKDDDDDGREGSGKDDDNEGSGSGSDDDGGGDDEIWDHLQEGGNLVDGDDE